MKSYDQVYALWKKIHGFGLRSIDDSRDGVEKFFKTKSDNQLSWRQKTENRRCDLVRQTEDEAVCITSVWMKRTADVESGKQWSYSPWRLYK